MTAAAGNKSVEGNLFEDFSLGQEFRHATPRTLTSGDVALYIALTGSRFPLHSSDAFARRLGLPRAPVDDLLVFHIVFGKSVSDISMNAIANLGYADCRFGPLVYPGDTLSAASTVIGLRETSNGKSGIVHVRTVGTNQRGEGVLTFVRWVMVGKRDPAAPPPTATSPELPAAVPAAEIVLPTGLDRVGYDFGAVGAPYRWDDYALGERIDHRDGVTVEEAEHMMATRLYQNTARIHFDRHAAQASRFGRRLVYGGHIISLARALSANGLGNGFRLAAINGGSHTAPVFAGDTIYAWSAVEEKIVLPGEAGFGALRLRTVALKDQAAHNFPDRDGEGERHASVVLDLDYTVLMPR